MTPELEQKINYWYSLQQQIASMAEVIAMEKTLRRELFGMAFPEPVLGTNRLGIGHGKDLKATHKMGYRIDKDAMQTEAEKMESELFHRVIKFKPEVHAATWAKLTVEERLPFGEFVTETPGMPELEITNVSTRGR